MLKKKNVSFHLEFENGEDLISVERSSQLISDDIETYRES